VISKRDMEEAARALGITEERRSRRESVVVRQFEPDEDAQAKALATLLRNENGVAELLARMRAESKPPKATMLGHVGEDRPRSNAIAQAPVI
jgi:hypothetical protein